MVKGQAYEFIPIWLHYIVHSLINGPIKNIDWCSFVC